MTLEARVTGIRSGLVRIDQALTASSPWQSRGTFRVITDGVGVYAANGFLNLSAYSKMTAAVPGKGPDVRRDTRQIDRIEYLSGSLFPIAVGNQFSYKVHTTSTTASNRYDGAMENTCRVTEKRNASAFHPNLSGDAFVIQCETTDSFGKDKPKKSKNPTVFFAELGYFLAADVLDSNNSIVTGGTHIILMSVATTP
jgi:hypothetical protein